MSCHRRVDICGGANHVCVQSRYIQARRAATDATQSGSESLELNASIGDCTSDRVPHGAHGHLVLERDPLNEIRRREQHQVQDMLAPLRIRRHTEEFTDLIRQDLRASLYKAKRRGYAKRVEEVQVRSWLE